MIVPTTIAVARPRPMERCRLLMAYLGAHDRQRTAALAALRRLPAPRQCRAARRRPAPPLDGVRGRAPVLVRERDRRRLQRAAHAGGEAAGVPRLARQGVTPPLLLRYLLDVHLRARRAGVRAVRRHPCP